MAALTKEGLIAAIKAEAEAAQLHYTEDEKNGVYVSWHYNEEVDGSEANNVMISADADVTLHVKDRTVVARYDKTANGITLAGVWTALNNLYETANKEERVTCVIRFNNKDGKWTAFGFSDVDDR
jgi:hypothetical protein